jgi:hypothetical protein|tara:strand:+ start:87 stop:296 length:210 start_codon:yes stop_codon:yes gene_type:complete
MPKYKNITEKTKQSILDKIFYNIARGLRPTILNKMAKKDPRVAKNLKNLERARNDFYDSLDAFDKKYGK